MAPAAVTATVSAGSATRASHSPTSQPWRVYVRTRSPRANPAAVWAASTTANPTATRRDRAPLQASAVPAASAAPAGAA